VKSKNWTSPTLKDQYISELRRQCHLTLLRCRSPENRKASLNYFSHFHGHFGHILPINRPRPLLYPVRLNRQRARWLPISFDLLFFKSFIAQKIQRDTQGYKIVPLTNLPYLSFAEASDRVSTVLVMCRYSSEKQVQREKHCGNQPVELPLNLPLHPPCFSSIVSFVTVTITDKILVASRILGFRWMSRQLIY
jgi:hypothetical protein